MFDCVCLGVFFVCGNECFVYVAFALRWLYDVVVGVGSLREDLDSGCVLGDFVSCYRLRLDMFSWGCSCVGGYGGLVLRVFVADFFCVV